MHTTCPECSSVFRVTAEQLNVAHGQVRCGYCQTIFDALGSLEDDWKEQLPSAEQAQEAAPVEQAPLTDAPPAQEPQAEAAADPLLDELLEPCKVDEPIEPAGLVAEQAPAQAIDIKQQAKSLFDEIQEKLERQSVPPASSPETSNKIPEILTDKDEPIEPVLNDRDQNPHHIMDKQGTADAVSDMLIEDAPKVLRDELAAINAGHSGQYNLAWLGGIALMLAILVLQGGYYFRDTLAQSDNYRGLVVAMCKLLSCDVPLRDDAARGVKTLMMREHDISPIEGKTDQLQVRTVFTNTANYRQSYPVLVIRMTDEVGKQTSMRRFLPQEYLAAHIDINEGLPAHTSVEVIYNITKPQIPLLSYNIEFE